MMTASVKLRIFSAFAALVMMITVFYMSAQNGEKSASLSGGVTDSILSKTDSEFDTLPDEEKIVKADNFGHILRKVAHFCEFFVLGGIFAVFMFTFDIKRLNSAVIAAQAGIIYALSDEIHQYFVPGRGCRFTDVLIDCAGVVCAVALVTLLCLVIDKRSSRKA